MTKNGEFNSRWGNAIADDFQYCHVPGYILRNYAKCVSLLDVLDKSGEIDIKRGQIVDLNMQDMMFVIHVMAFKYDAPNGKATPGLPTIAEYSGIHVTGLRRIKKKLISYGLLTVQSEIGRPDTYNFAGLHDQCVRVEHGLPQIEGVEITPSKSARASKSARGWASKSARGVVANPLVEESSKGIKKSTAQKSAGKSTAPKQKPIFDLVALKSFNLTHVNGDKELGARIGKIDSWLNKKNVSLERLEAFYKWYDKKTDKSARPRDVGKFAEWFTQFEAIPVTSRIIQLEIEPTDYPDTSDYVNLAGGA